MIDSAVRLLAERGLEGTSFAEVLERSGAPRGSVYHHFPEGKDQLIGEALDAAGAVAIDLLDRKAGAPADEVAAWFLHIWREVLVRSDLDAGCAVLAVTVATESPELRRHAARIFRTWRSRLAELLEQGRIGCPPMPRRSRRRSSRRAKGPSRSVGRSRASSRSTWSRTS